MDDKRAERRNVRSTRDQRRALGAGQRRGSVKRTVAGLAPRPRRPRRPCAVPGKRDRRCVAAGAAGPGRRADADTEPVDPVSVRAEGGDPGGDPLAARRGGRGRSRRRRPRRRARPRRRRRLRAREHRPGRRRRAWRWSKVGQHRDRDDQTGQERQLGAQTETGDSLPVQPCNGQNRDEDAGLDQQRLPVRRVHHRGERREGRDRPGIEAMPRTTSAPSAIAGNRSARGGSAGNEQDEPRRSTPPRRRRGEVGKRDQRAIAMWVERRARQASAPRARARPGPRRGSRAAGSQSMRVPPAAHQGAIAAVSVTRPKRVASAAGWIARRPKPPPASRTMPPATTAVSSLRLAGSSRIRPVMAAPPRYQHSGQKEEAQDDRRARRAPSCGQGRHRPGRAGADGEGEDSGDEVAVVRDDPPAGCVGAPGERRPEREHQDTVVSRQPVCGPGEDPGPWESTTRSPPAGRISSSKSSLTSCGGVASTAPSAGFEPTSRAWAEAAAGKASAVRRTTRLLALRKDELEQIRPGRDEATAAVEGLGAVVPTLDDDLEPARAVRNRVSLGPLEQLLADASFCREPGVADLFDPKLAVDSSIAT